MNVSHVSSQNILDQIFNRDLLQKVRDKIATRNSSAGVSCPSKVFLMGEYSVLWGQPALLLGLEPSFSMSVSVDSREGFSAWGKDFLSSRSPAGILMRAFQDRLAVVEKCPLYFQFKDPIQGKGGLGASTAQFLLILQSVYRLANMSDPTLSRILELYRDLSVAVSESSLQPSGADLVTQAMGKGVVFRPSKESLAVSIDVSGLEHQLMVFLATSQSRRKVPTHEHLVGLNRLGPQRIFSDRWLETALSWTQAAQKALQNSHWEELGAAMSGYGQFLCESELESKTATEDRLFFQEVPGVLGVKGAGALLSDVLCVLLKAGLSPSEERELRANVILEAEKRNLSLITRDGSVKLAVPKSDA